jgi:hypothetical protein
MLQFCKPLLLGVLQLLERILLVLLVLGLLLLQLLL